jgi:DNA-binding beta-propeller fold protein YncE
MVNLSTKEVWTLAGEVNGAAGHVNGVARRARFSSPAGVAVTPDGKQVLVADTGNNLVRIVQMDEALRGVSVATLAGGGGAGQFDGPETPTAGYADGVGTAALFREPTEICVIETAEGIVAFVADSHNFRVRKIVLSEDRRSGVVTTLLGTGEYGSADGSWRRASFKGLSGLAVSPDGDKPSPQTLNTEH